jgi:putative spermidine/putrescine transport system ATP-binding protein/spermidine/putrescine transport system ATP-binding protein
MIAGLEYPSAGDILVKDRRINDIPVHRRNFGMVFQDHALFPHKTAFDNIAFGLKYRNASRAEVERRVRRALEIVRLPNVGGRLPRELSGGQQQRVALARAIVIEPDLLLFDEPLSALDANLREEMRVELKRIHHTLGITAIYVTHDQAEALSMSDRVVLMREGRIEQEGTPDELYRNPVSEFSARFFGQVNDVEGVVAGVEGNHCRVRLDGGMEIGVAQVHTRPGDRVRLLLRAERAAVAPAFPDGPGFSTLKGTITACDYLGVLTRYVVDVGGIPLIILQSAGHSMMKVGEHAAVRIPVDAWMAFGPATAEKGAAR